ncbi:Rv1355c family protein [Tomitella fengzijianii]|uniref:Rv1355c family protein n=1 Tax=Tomitella fengzijianii TaxID=2597660 RepID=A0A516X5G9_9ACTN|nr:Rv1355c family protein [Tomitella fengzijianii]QDQ98290.1 Rv1355c family protein [Tomitella fengzijianii]
MTGPGDARAHVLDPADPADHERIDALRADPAVEVLDTLAQQRAGLAALLPAPDAGLMTEPPRWVHYPWRRSLVALLGPRGYRRLRLDRNRHKITAGEQERLNALTIAVIGSSAGYAVAQQLALEGLCGRLVLADFDHLEVSNLNRVAAGVLELGLNKAVVAARRIAELDPYLPVHVHPQGATPAGIDALLDGVGLLVEECDALEMKVQLREHARSRRIPVLMATSDRGLLDVERFDLEPRRPVLHGVLGGVDGARLAGLSNADKVPHVLRILDAALLSTRGAASLLEVGHTIGTWPQLAGDVAAGGAAVAAAVRRIGIGRPLPSGRVRIDIDEALDGIALPGPRLDGPEPPGVREAPSGGGAEADAEVQADPAAAVAFAAARAPSGGNAQPWTIELHGDGLTLRLDPAASVTMDLHRRGSAVALGAALHNARAAAAAHGILGPAEYTESAATGGTSAGGEDLALPAVRLRFGGEADPDLAASYPGVLRRETNRNTGRPRALDPRVEADLRAAARREGGGLRLLTGRGAIEDAARVLAAADRVRYLDPRLHAEMISELCEPGPDGPPPTGIDVRSLGLSDADLAVLGVVRRADVMAALADRDEREAATAGAALGEDTRTRVLSGSALAVVTCPGRSLRDHVRGGAATEAVWVCAQRRGLSVHPMSPVFLYAQASGDRTPDDHALLSRRHADELRRLHREFAGIAGLAGDRPPALVLRLSHDAAPVRVRSRRRAPCAAAAPAGAGRAGAGR